MFGAVMQNRKEAFPRYIQTSKSTLWPIPETRRHLKRRRACRFHVSHKRTSFISSRASSPSLEWNILRWRSLLLFKGPTTLAKFRPNISQISYFLNTKSWYFWAFYRETHPEFNESDFSDIMNVSGRKRVTRHKIFNKLKSSEQQETITNMLQIICHKHDS